MATGTNAIATRAEGYKLKDPSSTEGTYQLITKTFAQSIGLTVNGTYTPNQCVKYHDLSYESGSTYVSLSITANDIDWSATTTTITYDFTKRDGTHETGQTTYTGIDVNTGETFASRTVYYSGHGLFASTDIIQSARGFEIPFYISAYEEEGLLNEYNITLENCYTTVYYQYDNYNPDEWVEWENPSEALTLSWNNIIYFMVSGSSSAIGTFVLEYLEGSGSEHLATVKIGGNIMSLVNTEGKFQCTTTITEDYAFSGLCANCEYIDDAYDLLLPATELTVGCYASMFENCSNLRYSPRELPATALTDGCYQSMFNGCTSLITSPFLPAQELTASGYSSMFYGCSSLTNITCLATNISASGCVDAWVSGVTSPGTFIKHEGGTWTEIEIPTSFTPYIYEESIIFSDNSPYINIGNALYGTDRRVGIKEKIHFNHAYGVDSELFGTSGTTYNNKVNVKIMGTTDQYYILPGTGGSVIVDGIMSGEYVWELVNGSPNTGSSENYFSINNEVLVSGLTFGDYSSSATTYYIPGCNVDMTEQPLTLYDAIIRSNYSYYIKGNVYHHYVPANNGSEFVVIDTITGDNFDPTQPTT